MRVQGLYPVVDFQATENMGLLPVPVALHLLQRSPSLLQLRAKNVGSGSFLEALDAIVPVARQYGVCLVVNDRADLAKLAGAAAVHVGQHDMSIEQVRAFDSTLLLGCSTHSVEQLRDALTSKPDYAAFGPVFATQSKQNPEPEVGLALLEEAHALTREAGVPLVAIGGIDADNIAAVKPHCEAVAIIAALLRDADSVGSVVERYDELAALWNAA